MPLACITGDVHHYLGYPIIGGHNVQKNEHIFAMEYLDILKKYKFKATLFVTGKCIVQHRPFWVDFLSSELIELGAHTYAAFQPDLIHTFFRYALNTTYGPYFYQYLDIKRTVGALKLIGVKPKAWRTHAYAGDHVTYKLLEKFGFSIVSDEISLGNLKIINVGALKHIPITSIPDDKIAYFYFKGMTQRMIMEGEKVFEFILNLIEKRKDMVLQLHPICMKLLDNFKTFEKILKRLSQCAYLTFTITELSHDDKPSS